MRLAAGIAACVVLHGAGAQDRSSAPLTLLVGFAPGGATDIIARLIAPSLKAALGRDVLIENKPGAGGLVAAEDLKRAAADGSTMLVTPLFVPVLAPLTYDKLAISPSKDFAPVAQIVKTPLAFAVAANHPARNLREFIAWAKAHPKQASFGTPAAGSIPHFLGVWLGKQAGVDIVHVAYRGSTPLAHDLMGGQIPATANVLPDLIAMHRAGAVRILAISGEARSPLCPEVPTFVEQGFANIDAQSWFAIYAPAATPQAVRERLATAVAASLKTPEVRERLVAIGYEPTGTTPDQLTAIEAAEIARWAPIVRTSGFRAE